MKFKSLLIAKKVKGRRSSLSRESLGAINYSDSQEENLSELIEKVVDSQYQWIQNQIDSLQRRNQESKIKADKSIVALNLNGLNSKSTKIDLTEASNDQEYELLSKEQINFLKSTEITSEMVLKNLKKYRQHEIKKVLERINNSSLSSESNRQSFLTNKYSRMSISASCIEENKNATTSRDVIQILNEFFES